MSPRIKYGLIVGLIGGVMNVCVAALFGLCSPVLAIVLGVAAGFLTAREERLASQGEGAKAGMIAGAIAGVGVMLASLVTVLGLLLVVQFGNVDLAFGQAPSTSAPMAQQILYYVSGLATGGCFGIASVVTSAIGGAAAGYFGTSVTPATPASPAAPTSF